MKYNCERHSEAQVQRGRTCVACEMEALQQQITRAQMLSTRMWNWMRNPDHAKDLSGEELQARFQQEFREAH